MYMHNDYESRWVPAFLFIEMFRDYIESLKVLMNYFYIRWRNCAKWKLRILISIECWPYIESLFEVWNFSSSFCCNERKEPWFLLKLLFVGATLHKRSIRQTGLIQNFQFWFDPVLINKSEGYSLKVIFFTEF